MAKGRGGKEERLGDETRARIEDLKGGWKLPGAPAEEQSTSSSSTKESPTQESSQAASASARTKPKTMPPPAPGSKTRGKGPTKPPPLARNKPATLPPPPPSGSSPSARTKKPSVAPPPAPVAAAAAVARNAAESAPVALPSLPKARSKEPTKPPPAPAAAAPRRKAPTKPTQPPPMRAPGQKARPSLPPAAIVSKVGADDDDPTRLTTYDSPDGVAPKPAIAASGQATGSVRLPDALPRSGGVLGDIAYLFRVFAKKRSAQRELESNAEKIANEKEARNHKLLEMARQAVGDDRYDQSLVDRARATLLAIEEKRSHHAGRVAAADEKVAVLQRHRSDEQSRRTAERERLKMEINAIDTSLAPLLERASTARKRTAKLHRQLESLDEKVRKKEASLVSVDGPANKAAIHAEIASLKAERDGVAADEPTLAAEVDDLDPKIASLNSTRADLKESLASLDRDDGLDEVRVAEKVSAVKASRVVETRAVSDQSSKRQEKLLELGEALHNEPPDTNNPRLRAIVKHDLEIGTLERRSLELKELIESVELAPRLRGALYLLLIAGALAGLILVALSR